MFIAPGGGALKIALFVASEVGRYGVGGMLNNLDAVGGVTSFGSAEETIRAGADSYDLVVMPATALAGAEDVAQELISPSLKVLLLVDDADRVGVSQRTASCVRALLGWSGLTPTVLGDAIADIMAGKFHVSPTLALQVLRHAGRQPAGAPVWQTPGTPLTPRENEVLNLVAKGLSNKQVARRLQISEHGVKRLVGNVLAKLNCPNRTLAVVRAIEHGLLANPAETSFTTSVA